MLKGISPLINTSLFTLINNMGHGDQLVLADAHFPAFSTHTSVVEMPGHPIDTLLHAILPLFELDSYIDHIGIMMEPAVGDRLPGTIFADYQAILSSYTSITQPIKFISRSDFYIETKKSFGVLLSGDTRKYANIILTKGVTPL